MKRLTVALACAALMVSGAAAGEPAVLELSAGDTVSGIAVTRGLGSRPSSLLVLEGRTLRIWRGARGGATSARATWTVELESDVSFVDSHVNAPEGDDALLMTLGARGIGSVVLRDDAGGRAVRRFPPETSHGLGWHDPEQARFADLQPGGRPLVPRKDGWALLVPEDEVYLRLQPYREVTAPGPFLEDTCRVVHALPGVFVGEPAAPGGRKPALWAIDGRTLVSQARKQEVRYDLAFLSAESGAEFDQTLVDLDLDGRPDVLHRIHTNRETRYGFFRTKPAEQGAKLGPSHKPATSALFLSGFQLEPDLVDLDGDGLKDLVVTSMQINAPNMMGALMSGRVTAETRAFLNRWREGKGAFFDAKPDAVVKSQIGVKVQFNYAGNIEVIRSFTILLDGDFDGDGRKDLAIRTAPDELTIRRGTKAGVWAGDKETFTLKIPPKGKHPDIDGYTADMNGDGKDEIVLVYRKPSGGRDRVRIVDPGL